MTELALYIRSLSFSVCVWPSVTLVLTHHTHTVAQAITHYEQAADYYKGEDSTGYDTPYYAPPQNYTFSSETVCECEINSVRFVVSLLLLMQVCQQVSAEGGTHGGHVATV